ncbi:hypothetical protein ZIOFF_013615 [Zingiber officinale]|uniref:ceramide glucosyltransferase n=1 Tax=Zingiber officinale TaxID=94328 RepID=A0A8J5LCY6_ZINOF|nr:hypothetical protein ZIOFF_013615 [Zingiber officinale]
MDRIPGPAHIEHYTQRATDGDFLITEENEERNGGDGREKAMAVLETLDAFLASASRACCSPLAVFIQIQRAILETANALTSVGITMLCSSSMSFRWLCNMFNSCYWMGPCCLCQHMNIVNIPFSSIRSRTIHHIKCNIRKGNSFAFICGDINDLEHSAQMNLPGVSVIMPLKGFGEHNLQNWRTQITSLYGGPLEFLFVVESSDDPAYTAVSSLISEFQDNIDAKIVVAGLTTTCSQKIHNQLIGVQRMHKDSKYVLFLDDDIRLHPGSIGALTAEMEKNPEIFIQTGYPLDLPSGSLGSYCIYEYHMFLQLGGTGRTNAPVSQAPVLPISGGKSMQCQHPESDYMTWLQISLPHHSGPRHPRTMSFEEPCSMGFATGGKTFFLWGGCMMMHAEDFRKDLYGVVSGLSDGGYSDDMTLAAIAEGGNNVLTKDGDFSERRCDKVGGLDGEEGCEETKGTSTLSNVQEELHGILNLMVGGQHKRLIWSPPVAIFPHPLASDLSFPRYWNYLRKQTFVLESYISEVNWMMNRALFSTHCYLSWGFVLPYFMALIHVAAFLRAPNTGSLSKESSSSYTGLLLVIGLLISTVIELLSMWSLTKVEVQLCNMLSPEGATLSLDSYKWGFVFLAMLVDNFWYPISAIRSHFSKSINWSGIRYHLKDGKISKIERSMENGPSYSDLAWKKLYGKIQPHPKGSLINYLSRKYSLAPTKEV